MESSSVEILLSNSLELSIARHNRTFTRTKFGVGGVGTVEPQASFCFIRSMAEQAVFRQNRLNILGKLYFAVQYPFVSSAPSSGYQQQSPCHNTGRACVESTMIDWCRTGVTF